jgi:hypothetical protein
MDIIQSPLNQLLIFLSVWGINYLIKWRDEKYAILSGVFLFSFWELAGVILGVPGNIQWNYYLYLMGALLAAYIVYFLCLTITDKWGNPYDGKGGLLILAPLIIFPILVTPAAIIKFVIQLLN